PAGRHDCADAGYRQKVRDGAVDAPPFTVLTPDAHFDSGVSTRCGEHSPKSVAPPVMIVRMDELQRGMARNFLRSISEYAAARQRGAEYLAGRREERNLVRTGAVHTQPA